MNDGKPSHWVPQSPSLLLSWCRTSSRAFDGSQWLQRKPRSAQPPAQPVGPLMLHKQPRGPFCHQVVAAPPFLLRHLPTPHLSCHTPAQVMWLMLRPNKGVRPVPLILRVSPKQVRIPKVPEGEPQAQGRCCPEEGHLILTEASGGAWGARGGLRDSAWPVHRGRGARRVSGGWLEGDHWLDPL